MKTSFTAGIFPFMILLMLGCKPTTTDRINKEASITGIKQLPENPLEMTPLAVTLQPEEKTMATLYGNSIAAKRLKDGMDYGAGSVLYLVTWKGKADPDWFGARIPDRVTAIERVSIGGNGQKNYIFFKGPAKNADLEISKDDRQAKILDIPVATSP
ncbi:hypothetical protein [Pedobacter sp. UBA5917]|jgi:hypothetical protein|uniref:hypothetical protein n=1 Tax=Pedobacter sp. UBA5917 TaxID=1947061 RepID=UPI0025FB5080|nr:hypothetical protein [Pedobacter sp. UBA5917]